MSGKLIVFEGVDGIGKSTLSKEVAVLLAKWKIPSVLLAFPGNEVGTLGHLVYRIHHDPGSFGLSFVSALAMQTLHIAAHFDAIERNILPELEAGTWVILDRFWWSTWVYGIEQGINPTYLEPVIQAEQTRWGSVKPDLVFMVDRTHAIRAEHDADSFQRLRTGYQVIAEREKHLYKIFAFENEDFSKSAALISAQVKSLIPTAGKPMEESK
jgi:dTMP kinase